MKALLAKAIRDSGGTAIVEAFPDSGDAGGWRADVLGIGPDSHRVAFEVQLAGMTVAEGWARSAKYDADGIQVVWVTPRTPHWLYGLPSMSVSVKDEVLMLEEGVATWRDDSWSVWRGQPAQPVVKAWLEGRMRVASPAWLSEERERGWLFHPEAVLWSNIDMVAAWKEHTAAEALRQEQEEAERERHRLNIDALTQRQQRTLQLVTPRVALQNPGSRVWLGVPPTPWDGRLPVSPLDATGNEKTGFGCVIWVGAERQALRLHTVVSPVASRLSPGLGASWRKRGVTVIAETEQEAENLAANLGWAANNIEIAARPAAESAPPTAPVYISSDCDPWVLPGEERHQ